MKKLLVIAVICAIALMAVMGIAPVKASSAVFVTSWPVDVTQADATWGEPVGISVAAGDPSWVSGYLVNGTSQSADFTMHFQRQIDGGYVEKVPVTDGASAHCPDGYGFIDPSHPTLCAIQTNVGSTHKECETGCPSVEFSASHQVVDVPQHYVYADKIIDVPGHYTCPSGWTLDGSICKKPGRNNQNATWVGPTYKCPEGYSTYAGHDNCRKLIATTYKTESFGPVVISYVGGHDGHTCSEDECNRPDKDALEEDYDMPHWAIDIFEDTYPESKDPIDVNCIDVQDSPIYGYADLVPATDPVYACPDGSTETTDGQCQLPAGTEDLFVQYLLNLPAPGGPIPTPACDPHGGCTGSAAIWENIKGPIETGNSLYGTGKQSMDITWTGADICEWNPGYELCQSRLPFVTIKVRAPQQTFSLYLDGVWLTPETVNAADKSVWYVFRAQISDDSVQPAFTGVNVLDNGRFWIMDQTQTIHWWEAAKAFPWVYPDCSDAPDFGDTRLENGIAEMGRFPGMVTDDVAVFLELNGVPHGDAIAWAFDTWHELAFGKYAALPASFKAVQP
jgi:hypothetical protein